MINKNKSEESMKAEKVEQLLNEYPKFVISYYAKKHGKHITRNAKWTDKCKEFISQKGIACMVYLDLDADGYRTATGKWSIK